MSCIKKGKAGKKSEFGTKVSVVTPLDCGLTIGMMALPGNPYDGHTLSGALEQVVWVCGEMPEEVHVDRGYRGHGVENVLVCSPRKSKQVTKAVRKRHKRRNMVEAMIGHMKSDGRLARSTLKGELGDAVFAVLCGCGQNIRLLQAHLHQKLCPGRIWPVWRIFSPILAFFRNFSPKTGSIVFLSS